MASNSKRGNGASQAAALPDPLAAAGDLQRMQMRMATESLCAVFRAFEAMRRVQEHAAHTALTRHAAAVERLNRPCDTSELMNIQSDLMKFDLEAAGQYWQQLWAAGMQMQAELANCNLHLMDENGLREAAATWQSVPLFQMPNGSAQSAR
jgi:hypothetical protein